MDLQNSDFEPLLQKAFLLPQFRLGQKDIISAILAKKDVLAVLPTGGGKSLCYQFSAVKADGLVIVISPLIALMKDQVSALTARGIRAGCLHSGQTDDERRAVFSSLNKGGAFILYLSPERVQKEGFQTWIQKRDVVLFAIDEAHCVSQWGHDFREEYGQLKILKQLKPDVPILALTASATPTVLTDIAKNLNLKNPERMIHGFYRPNLYYQVESCADDDEKMNMLIQAIQQNPTGRILIYCGTRKVTESLAESLSRKFTGVGYYHAGLPTEERTATQDNYSSGQLRILVATNAFGMGIDQPDVRLVVHFQMPANIDSLYQEMGRAGRDGHHSTCLMLYAKKDKGLQSYFIQTADAPKKIKDSRWRNLETLVNYSEAFECRHAEILTYYKDSQRITSCGHCDVCDPSSVRRILKPKVQASSAPLTKLKKSSSKSKTGDAQVLNAFQEETFQRLRHWRKAKALELDVPAFIVFGDQTLRHIAVQQPKNLDELKLVHGVGEMKLEKFGWDILAEIKS